MGIRSHGTGIGSPPFPSYLTVLFSVILLFGGYILLQLLPPEVDGASTPDPVPQRDTGCRVDKLEEGATYNLAGRTYKCVVVAGCTGLVHQTSSCVITFLPPLVSRRETETGAAKLGKGGVE